MAAYLFSAVKATSIAFKYNTDVLIFDTGSAADLGFTLSGTTQTLRLGLDSVALLNTALRGFLTSTNVTFADGSQLLIGDDTTGTAGDALANTLQGGAGNDQLIGLSGNDSLDGGEGSDTYLVTGANDGVDLYQDSGVNGFDRILAGAVGAVIRLTPNFSRAASGIDAISANGYSGVTIAGGTGADVLDFTGMSLTGIVRIDAQAGADRVIGSSGNDTIKGGTGNDLIDGAGGSDTYLVSTSNDGTDSYRDSGIGGVDQIVAGANAVAIHLEANFSRALTGIENISANGYTGVTVTGTTLADTLNFSGVGLSAITLIDAQGGIDNIVGSSGNDTIKGGTGNDTIDGAGGSDTYVIATAGDGTDIYRDSGASGVDQIVAGANAVPIRLEANFSAARTGIEAISAGLYTGVSIAGGAGADVFDFTGMSLSGIALIDAQAGNDNVVASSGDDSIKGGAGNDTIDGGAGRDTALFAGTMATYALTSTGGVVQVRDLNTVTNGNDGTDTLRNIELLQFLDATLDLTAAANRAPVAVNDGITPNSIFAFEDGAPIQIDVLANDTDPDVGDSKKVVSVSGLPLYGAVMSVRADGSGLTYSILNAFQHLTAGEQEIETFTYTMQDTAGAQSSATVTVTVIGVNDAPVAVDDFESTRVTEDSGPLRFDVLRNDTDPDGNPFGNDTMTVVSLDTTGTHGSVRVIEAGGALEYSVGNAFQALRAGESADDFFFYTIEDGAHAQHTAKVHITVIGADEPPPPGSIFGTAFNDIINTATIPAATNGADTVFGLFGDDLIGAAGGADTVYGGPGRDELDGGAGNDVLVGNADRDELTGGVGADRFVFETSSDAETLDPDRILDFSSAEGDKIDLSQIDADELTAGNQAFTLVAGFTGVAGQLAFDPLTGLLQGDVNGDAAANFAIEVRLVSALSSSDFVL